MDAAVIPPATPVRKRPKWSIHKSTAPPISMYLRHKYTEGHDLDKQHVCADS